MHVTATASAAAPAAGLQHLHPFANTLTTTPSATQRTAASCCLSIVFLHAPGFRPANTHSAVVTSTSALRYLPALARHHRTLQLLCVFLAHHHLHPLLTYTTPTPLPPPARRDALIAFDSRAHTNSTRILTFAHRHSRFTLLDALLALLSLRAAARTPASSHASS